MKEDAESVNVVVLLVLVLVGALVGHFTRARQTQMVWLGVALIGAVLLLAGFVTIPVFGYVGGAMLGAGLVASLTLRS